MNSVTSRLYILHPVCASYTHRGSPGPNFAMASTTTAALWFVEKKARGLEMGMELRFAAQRARGTSPSSGRKIERVG